jgi:glucoamylase
MYRSLAPETGLAPVTKDLWEERDSISTYACASTWGAFNKLSELALMLGEIAHADHWRTAAANLKVAIETHLWDNSTTIFSAWD